MATMPKRYFIAILAFIGQMFFGVMQDSNYLISSDIGNELNYRDLAQSEFIRYIAWTGSCFAGILVNRHGGATIFGFAIAINAIFNLFIFPVLHMGFALYSFVQFQNGVAQAFASCALADIWSRWSPSQERSRLMSFSYSGLIFGALLMYGIYSSFDIERRSLYLTISGVLPLIWSIIWLLIVKNDPVDDKSLSSTEKQYIVEKTEIVDRKRNDLSTYPWKSILTSKPVWISSITAFVAQNALTVTGYTGRYISENRIANIRVNQIWQLYGSLSVLTLFFFIFGYAADYELTRKHYTSTQIRKSYVCIGCLIGAISFTLVFFLLLDAITASLLLRSSYALIETAILVNAIELSPRYAALLSGIQKTFNNSAFLIGSLFVQRLPLDNEYAHWAIVFLSTASLLVLNAVLFYIWGSAELQPWNGTQNEEHELKRDGREVQDDNVDEIHESTSCKC